MELYLIRHTTPNVEKGVVYGQLDLDLDENFESEAEIILKKLPDNLKEVYSSPLIRCRKLAEKINENVVYDPRIMELDFGKWEGKKWDQIDPEKLSRWMKNFVSEAPPGGEGMMDLKNRVRSFLEEISEKNQSPVAVVTHAGVIRIIYSIVTCNPLESVFELKLEYGSVVKCLPISKFFQKI